jgi:hypothetical protein
MERRALMLRASACSSGSASITQISPPRPRSAPQISSASGLAQAFWLQSRPVNFVRFTRGGWCAGLPTEFRSECPLAGERTQSAVRKCPPGVAIDGYQQIVYFWTRNSAGRQPAVLLNPSLGTTQRFSPTESLSLTAKCLRQPIIGLRFLDRPAWQ